MNWVFGRGGGTALRSAIDDILQKLSVLIQENRFEELESDTLEIKPVPSEGGQWRERYKSVNAFLNTQGGILILGIKEECQGSSRRYVFTGYQDHAENKIKDLPNQFEDLDGKAVSIADQFPNPELRQFLTGRIALVYVDELAVDSKYCFYDKAAYKRVLTGDHKLSKDDIERQEESKQEMWKVRELQIVPDCKLEDLDLDKLNDYIQLLNRTVKVETIKPDLVAATPFLERKYFMIKGSVTTLGELVCGRYPGDRLGFRSQLHGFVEMPGEIALDKQDFTDNVLSLMENGLSFVLRNIQVGVSSAHGGVATPQYPERLLRETINNALAHRDYSIDRQVIVAIKPGVHLSIRNPGTFERKLLIEVLDHPMRVLRILPEAKPRNPFLANVLRVYRKWEGIGIGMATLVNLSLQNEIDLPYYRLYQDEVRLFICAGKLQDSEMELLFSSFDAYIGRKLKGFSITASQKSVLAYLIKSQRANSQERHTILLTPDNNHNEELRTLETAGLIYKHPSSPAHYPIYLADEELLKENYHSELQEMFGDSYSALKDDSKDCLNIIYRHQRFSSKSVVNASLVGRLLWAMKGRRNDDLRGFESYVRGIRTIFNRLNENGMLVKQIGKQGYSLNETYSETNLVF